LTQRKTEKKQRPKATTQLRCTVADVLQRRSDERRRDVTKAYTASSIDSQFAAMNLWLRATPQKTHEKQCLRLAAGGLHENQERGGDIGSKRKLPDPNPLRSDPRTWKPKY